MQANIDNFIQVHIPRQRSSHSFVAKVKCDVNSNVTHSVMISKEISFKSHHKEICSGEKKKVNLGYWGNRPLYKVENNSLVHIARPRGNNINGKFSTMALDGEVLSKFFSIHNIEPNWLHCNFSAGHYDEELGGWTGCMGQV